MSEQDRAQGERFTEPLLPGGLLPGAPIWDAPTGPMQLGPGSVQPMPKRQTKLTARAEAATKFFVYATAFVIGCGVLGAVVILAARFLFWLWSAL